MLLITAADVQAVYETSRDAAAIAPFLTATEAFTRQLIGKLANSVFKEVQRYCCAHFLFVTDAGLHESIRVDDVSEHFTRSKRGGLLGSRWGELAVAMDSTGTLAALISAGQPAEIELLGSESSSSAGGSASSVDTQTLNGSSLVETSSAGTSYILIGAGATESQWTLPPLTGTKLRVNRTAAAGVGCSITYTVRKNGVDTAMVLTLDADDVAGESAGGLEAVFDDGDKFSLKEVRTGAVAAGAMEWTFEYLPG